MTNTALNLQQNELTQDNLHTDKHVLNSIVKFLDGFYVNTRWRFVSYGHQRRIYGSCADARYPVSTVVNKKYAKAGDLSTPKIVNESTIKSCLRHREKESIAIFTNTQIKYLGLDLDIPSKDDLFRIYSLLIELGIPKNTILMSFSGSKGYHVDTFIDCEDQKQGNFAIVKRLGNYIKSTLGLDKLDIRGCNRMGYKIPFMFHYKTKKRCCAVNEYGEELAIDELLCKLSDMKKVEFSAIKNIVELIAPIQTTGIEEVKPKKTKVADSEKNPTVETKIKESEAVNIVSEKRIKDPYAVIRGKNSNKITMFSRKSLAWSRCQDIKKIAELRDFFVVGYRNKLLHVYAYNLLCNHVAKDDTLKHVKALNDRFKACLSDSNIADIVNSTYNSYISGKGYNYKNCTLISLLDISIEEQRELSTIISTGVKRERSSLKKREEHRNENEVTFREQSKIDNKNRVLELHSEGMSNVDISKATGLSTKWVRNIISEQRS